MGSSTTTGMDLTVWKRWPELLRRRLGPTHCPSGLPTEYISIDLETTGFYRVQDLVVQLGHSICIDGVVRDSGGFYLDWTRCGVDPRWIDARLAEVRKGIPSFSITAAKLQEEGEHPKDVLEFYLHLISTMRERDAKLLGYGWWQFDYQMMRGSCDQVLPGVEFELDADFVVDAGLLAKEAMFAAIPERRHKIKPSANHNLREHFHQVRYANSVGLSWKAETIAEMLGVPIDHANLHDAVVDAVMVQKIFEAMRGGAL